MKNKVRRMRPARYPGGDQPPLPYGDSYSPQSGDVRQSMESAYEVFRRQKWLMLFTFLAVVGAAVLYVLTKEPEYRAESFLVVEERQYDPSNALSMGYIPGLDNSSASMHLLVLTRSTSLAERVAERILELGTLPGTEERFSVLEDFDDPDTITPAALARRIQSRVISATSTVPNLISVSATSLSNREAAFLANLFAEEAVNQSQMTSRRRVASSRAFIEQQLQESARQLSVLEQEMEDYQRREGAVALDQEVQAAVTRMATLETTLAEATIEMDMRQAALEATERELQQIRPILSQRVASGVDREIQASQTRLAELEIRLESIYQQYPQLRQNPDHVSIAPIKEEMEFLRERIEQLSERFVNEVLAAGGVDPARPESGVAYAATLERELVNERIAISGLQSKIAALEEQKTQYEARLQSIPRQAMGLAQLERSRSSSAQLFTFLEQTLQEVLLAEESEIGSLHFIRPADVPVQPVSPRPQRIYPLAAILGIFLSVGAGAFSQRLDRRLHTPTDVSRTGSRLLGVIPDMRYLIKHELGGAKSVEFQGRRVASNIVALLAPLSAPAEAYRQLYVRLRPTSGTKRLGSVIVTSPEASVGKSTTALNLAITTAMAHHRTLVVDVDLRRPAIERYLGISTGVTLQDLCDLPDDVDLEPYVFKRTATSVPNLHAITVREPIRNPLEHLTAPKLQALIETFKTVFDVVIFDAPPLLLTSDAALLAPLCDATVVVASAGATDGAALQQIERDLEDCDARLAGIVLNRFDASNRVFKSTYGYLQHNYAGYYRRVAS